MESICKNIRLENNKAEGMLQSVLEEDVNLAENKEDVDKILMQKGKVKIDEIKTASSHVFVKGKISYQILYRTLEETLPVQSIAGIIPFHEEIYVNCLEVGEHVNVCGELEDISVHTINSRKLNLRALLNLKATAEEEKEEEICMDIEEQDGINLKKQTTDLIEVIENKHDIFRIREEIELPKNMPNMAGIIWKDIRVQNFICKPTNDKIVLKGELILFVLYEPSLYIGDDEPTGNKELVSYETKVPFQGELECLGSREKMLLDMKINLGNESMDIRQDADQEMRVIGLDCSLNLSIHLYEEKEVSYIADAYGVKQQVNCSYKELPVKRLIQQKNESISMEENIVLEVEDEKIRNICYGSYTIRLESDRHDRVEEENVMEQKASKVDGYLEIEVLYQSIDEQNRIDYKTITADYPFSIHLEELPLKLNPYQMRTELFLQDSMLTMLGNDKIGINVNLMAIINVYENSNLSVVSQVDIGSLDYEKMKEIPGMLIYYVENGDSLWQIGKKYYMDVEKIKNINQLKDDNIKKGDKLLLIKEI